jgi:uncharacterized protein YjfI (DUF2170 family)
MFPVNFQQLGVWIDWNDDGDFDDDAEQQHFSEDIPQNSNVSIDLLYPSTVPYGDYVRVRLITDIDNRYSGAGLIDSACYSALESGQSEDYTIFVQPSILSIDDNEINELKIYVTTAPKELVINGQLTASTIANLYDIQGRLVMSQKLKPLTNSNTLEVSSLGTGIYIIKIFTNSQVKTQKVIIK